MKLFWIAGKVLLFLIIKSGLSLSSPYYGSRIGQFSTHFHDVRGEVYAVDDKTLFIRGFNYDGHAEDAFFWAGDSIRPDSSGFVIPNKGSYESLHAYHNQDLLLRLPEGKQVNDIRWLSVWSRKHTISFGSMIFPNSLVTPRPVVIGPLIHNKHGVSSGEILILDTQTFLVPDFSYDGTGKGAYWWISRGMKPNIGGLRLQEENGSQEPLGEYKNKIVIVTLPDGYSITDYDILSVWSTVDVDDYGSVQIPKDIKVPPSPRTLGTQRELETIKYNCEMLNDNLGLEIRWLISGDDIIMRLVGIISPSEYMALGLSKDDTQTRLDSADAILAWVDPAGKGHAVDYFLDSTESCENGRGMCPDTVHEGSYDNLIFLNATRADNATIITFKRPLKAEDKVYDQNIYTDGPQAILWAVGPLYDGLAGPPKLQTRGNLLLDFGREPNWNCPPPKEETMPIEFASSEEVIIDSKPNVFEIHCPSDQTFRVQLGPSGRRDNKRVWYVNGLPTPKIVVQRGKPYTFIIEGGNKPPIHHPFYITSSENGGLYQNLLEGKEISEQFYAGIYQNSTTGSFQPVADGRLCEWTLSDIDPEYSLAGSSSPLILRCEPGEAGMLTWTPNEQTPDNVYYQSFSEKDLGGVIRILDFCEETNPLYYLENEAEKAMENFGNFEHKIKTNLEREDNVRDLVFIANSKDHETNTQKEELERNIHPWEGKMPESMPTEIDTNKDPEGNEKASNIKQVINYFIGSDEGSSISAGPLNTENENKNTGISDSPEDSYFPADGNSESDSIHPHDESERSDKNLSPDLNPHSEAVFERNRIPVGFHSHIEGSPLKKQTHNSVAIQSAPTQITQPPPGFRPQFEGGFVPLVLNPVKEKESVLSKDFVLPPLHLRRPHRPFLFNESIPFHGTFKPGVPDFSGFNISNYSQEDSSVPLNHVQDNLPLLSAPKPQLVQRPISALNGLPPELFQRQKGLLQRPQILGYGPRQQVPNFGRPHQTVFAQLPPKHLGNIRIPGAGEEELAEVSSQRVHVSLQNPTEEKEKTHGLRNLQRPSIQVPKRPHIGQVNKVRYPPPIQRRPDIVEEGEGPINPHRFKPPQQNEPFPQLLQGNLNKHTEHQRIPSVPERGGLRGGPTNLRRPFPGPKAPFNNMNQGLGPRRIPPLGGAPKQPHPIMQRPLRERPPHFPGLRKSIPLRQRPPSESDIIVESMPDRPYPLRDRIRIHPHQQNIKLLDLPDESIIVEESDSSISKEQGELPILLNSGVIRAPNKNLQPQLVLLRQPPGLDPKLIHQATRPHVPQDTILANNNRGQNAEHGENPSPDLKPNIIQQLSSSQPHTRHPSVELPVDNKEIRKNAGIHQDVIDLIHNATLISNQSDDVDIKSTYVTTEKEDILKDDEDSESSKSEIHPSDFEAAILELNNFASFIPHTGATDDEGNNDGIPIQFQRQPDTSNSENEESLSPVPASIPQYHFEYNVPFGARLKIGPNGEQEQPRPIYQAPKRPIEFHRKPQLPHLKDKNVELPKLPLFVPPTRPPIVHVVKSVVAKQGEKIISNLSNQERQIENTEQLKPTYSTTTRIPLTDLPVEPNYFSVDSDDNLKLINDPKPVSPLVDQESPIKHPGRKHILPTSTDKESVPNLPPKVPENINLPHISENPPSHDNGTDYSILNHVLSLIGGPPEPSFVSPRNFDS